MSASRRYCFEGSTHFRARLVMATLSGKAIRIEHIRENAENPGLQSHEANLLQLLERLSNGTKIEINETGTVLKYVPGMIVGGKLTHDCGTDRAIGWFLEAVVALAPFAKVRILQ